VPQARLHDTRHTAATLLLQQGVPARVAMEMLGHSQISLTLGRYSHVVPELAKDAARRMGEALGLTGTLAAHRVPHPCREGDKRAGQRGGPRGDRTHNPRIKSPLLCQLS
jgi:hypothetical protein